MNKWHLWTSFGRMPPGPSVFMTPSHEYSQWTVMTMITVNSLTHQGTEAETSGADYSVLDLQFTMILLVLIWCGSSLSGGDFETQGELQGHIINLLLGRLFFKNVCVAILIRWKKEATFFVILCFIISRKVKMQLKHTKKEWEEVCAVYGEGAVTESMLQSRKFLKFHLENSH